MTDSSEAAGSPLSRALARSERWTGLPAKYATPGALAIISLLVGAFGMYWDIGWHVDFGRDESLFTVPHTLILVGIGGIVLSGALSFLVDGPPATGSLRVGGRSLSPGGLVVIVCSAAALAAFPLDDVWHRLFGEDLTLWSPTHLLLIGGGALSVLGLLMLVREGVGLGRESRFARFLELQLVASFLIGLSSFQAEFDFGVPQFRLLFHPITIALVAGIALVAARRLLGPLGALAAVGVYLLVRGGLAILVGAALDHAVPHFPLYVAEALVIELLALRQWRNPLAFGAAAGAGVGSVGLASEWLWSQIWMPYHWTASMLPEAAVLALVAGIAGGVVGARIACALRRERPASATAGAWAAAAVGAALVAAVVVLAIPLPRQGSAARATIIPFDTRPGSTQLRVVLKPADAAKGAEWFQIVSFQGGFMKRVSLQRTAPGTYVSEERVPVGPEREVVLRMAQGPQLAQVPISSAGDEPGERRVALGRRSQRFERESALPKVSGGRADLQKVGYLVVGATALLWLVLVARALALAEGSPLVPRRSRPLLRRPRAPRALEG